jgi:hypothetical protein
MRTLFARGLTAPLPWTTALGGALACEAHKLGQELFQPGLSQGDGVVAAGVPPLYKGLGALAFPVTTASAEAQAVFT